MNEKNTINEYLILKHWSRLKNYEIWPCAALLLSC